MLSPLPPLHLIQQDKCDILPVPVLGAEVIGLLVLNGVIVIETHFYMERAEKTKTRTKETP